MALPDPNNFRRDIKTQGNAVSSASASIGISAGLPDPNQFKLGAQQAAATTVGGLTSTQKQAIEQFKTDIGDYDWRAAYSYDPFSDEDQQRKAKGEMPISLYKKYDMDDPVDVALYNAGLPPRSAIESVAKKAKEAREEIEKANAVKPKMTGNVFEIVREFARDAKKQLANEPGTGAQATSAQANKTNSQTQELVDQLFVDPQQQAAKKTDTTTARQIADSMRGETPEAKGVFGVVGQFLRDEAAKDEDAAKALAIARAKRQIRENESNKEAIISALEQQYRADPNFTGEPETTLRKAAEDAFRQMQEQLYLEAAGAPEGVTRYEYEPVVEAWRLSLVKKAPDFEKIAAEPIATHGKEYLVELAEHPDAVSRYRSIANYMTDEEKRIFTYHVRTGDDESAIKYLDAISPQIDVRQSAQITAKFNDNQTLGSILTSVVAGLETGINGLRRAMDASGNYAIRSDGAWNEAYRGLRNETVGIAGIVSDVLYTIGNMAPSIGVGVLSGNPIIGSTAMGVSVAGNGYDQIKKEGGTDVEAATFGILSGLSEGFLQYFLGGIAGLSKNATGPLVGKVSTVLAKVFKNPKVLKVVQTLAHRLANASGEAFEEYLQDAVIEPAIRNIALGEELNIDLASPEALYSAFLGAITSLVFPAGAADTNTATPDVDTSVQGNPRTETTDMGNPISESEARAFDLELPFTEPPVEAEPDIYSDPLLDEIERQYRAEERAAIQNEPEVLDLIEMAELPYEVAQAVPSNTDPLIASILPELTVPTRADTETDVRLNTSINTNVNPASTDAGVDADTDANLESLFKTIDERAESSDFAKQVAEAAQNETGTKILAPDEAKALASIVGGLNEKSGKKLQWILGDRLSFSKTIDQNLDVVAQGKKPVRDLLERIIVSPLRKAQKQNNEMRLDIIRRHRQMIDELQLTPEMTRGAQWYAEGYKPVWDGEKYVAEPYSIEDLKREFPDSWERIRKANKWYRAELDKLYEQLDANLKKIYPNEEKRVQKELESKQKRADEADAAAKAAKEKMNNARAAYEEAKKTGSPDAEALGLVYEAAIEEAETAAAEARIASHELALLKMAIEDGTVYQGRRAQFRKNYYPHMMASKDGIAGLTKLLNENQNINTALVGKSEYTKPRSRWASWMQRREGIYSEATPFEAFERYATEAIYKLNYDPIIARVREVNQVIREASKESKHLEKLINYFDEYANDLAGKTNSLDRFVQTRITRKGMAVVKWLNSRAKSNAVLFNARSAIVQPLNIINAAAYIKNPAHWAKGAYDTMLRMMKNDSAATSIYNESAFLSGRTINRKLRKVQKGDMSAPQRFGAAMLEAGDVIAAEWIWWSAYEQYKANPDAINNNKKRSRTYESAIDYADDIARRSVAGRDVGDVPLTQKSTLTQLMFPFTVEVNNGWQVVTERIRKGDWGAILAVLIMSYLANEGYEKLTGDRPASFDLIDAFVDVVRTVQSDDWHDMEASEKFASTAGRVAGEIIGSSQWGALLVNTIAGYDENLTRQLFGDADPTRYGSASLLADAVTVPLIRMFTGKSGDYATDLLFNVGLPYGGRAASRALETVQNLGLVPDVNYGIDDGFTTQKPSQPTSYTDSGQVRFAADSDPLSIIQSIAFGQYSTPSGREYVESGAQPLSDKQTAVYETLIDQGTDAQLAEDTIRFLTLYKTSNGARHSLYYNENLTPEEKHIISSALLDENRKGVIDYFNGDAAFKLSLMGDETYQKATEARKVGISFEQYLDYYERVSALRKEKLLSTVTLMDYLNSQDLTEQQKKFLYENTGNYKWDNHP